MSKSAFYGSFTAVIGHPGVKICRYGRRYLPSWTIPMRSLPLWHLYWNSTSGSELIFPDRSMEIPPDGLVLIPSHTVFATRMNRDFEHFYIDFMVDMPYFNRIRKREIIIPVAPYLPLLEKNCGEHALQPMQMYAVLFTALLNIPPECFDADNEDIIDSRILEALKLIEQDSRFELNNYLLCEKLGMSISSFQRLFHHCMGLPPKQYILNLRLDMARNLLLNTTMSIADIAAKTGFADRYHFSKEFKAVLTLSPAAFRKSNGQVEISPGPVHIST